ACSDSRPPQTAWTLIPRPPDSPRDPTRLGLFRRSAYETAKPHQRREVQHRPSPAPFVNARRGPSSKFGGHSSTKCIPFTCNALAGKNPPLHTPNSIQPYSRKHKRERFFPFLRNCKLGTWANKRQQSATLFSIINIERCSRSSSIARSPLEAPRPFCKAVARLGKRETAIGALRSSQPFAYAPP